MAGKYTKIYAGAALVLVAGVLSALYVVLPYMGKIVAKKGDILAPDVWPTFVVYGTIPHLLVAFVFAEQLPKTIANLCALSCYWYGTLAFSFIQNIENIKTKSNWSKDVEDAEKEKVYMMMYALVSGSIGLVIVNILLANSVAGHLQKDWVTGEADPLLPKENESYCGCLSRYVKRVFRSIQLIGYMSSVFLALFFTGVVLAMCFSPVGAILTVPRWQAYVTIGTLVHLFLAFCVMCGCVQMSTVVREMLWTSLASAGWYGYLSVSFMLLAAATSASAEREAQKGENLDIFEALLPFEIWTWAGLSFTCCTLCLLNIVIALFTWDFANGVKKTVGEEPLQEETEEAV